MWYFVLLIVVSGFKIEPEPLLADLLSSTILQSADPIDYLETVKAQLELRRLYGITSLTAEHMVKTIDAYRQDRGTRHLNDLRKLAHDYATETRSILTYFLRAPYRVDTMPMVALFHLSREVRTMRYLTRGERLDLLTEIKEASLEIPVPRSRLESVSKHANEAFEAQAEMSRFLTGKAAGSKSAVARTERLLQEADQWTIEWHELLASKMTKKDYIILSNVLSESCQAE